MVTPWQLLSLALVALLWLLWSQLARRRDRRRRLASLTPPCQLDQLREGQQATLDGHLLRPGAQVRSLLGQRRCSAATLFAEGTEQRPAVDATVQAQPLCLTASKQQVELHGPVRVLVGSRERLSDQRIKQLSAETQARIEAADAVETIYHRDRLRAERVIEAQHRVRVSGTAHQLAGAEADYRQPAARWALQGSDRTPLQLACVGPVRTRRRWTLRWLIPRLVLAASLLALSGWGLDQLGRLAARAALNRLDRQEDASGWARWADRLYLAEGAVPLLGRVSHRRRQRLLERLAAGLQASLQDGLSRPQAVQHMVDFLWQRVPGLDPSPARHGPRHQLERLLRALGRDRDVVRLQREHPVGGYITERLRALLTLGDLAGALTLWWQPGAAINESIDPLELRRGVLLCAAGQLNEGLVLMARPAGWWRSCQRMDYRCGRRQQLYAACLLRAVKRQPASAAVTRRPASAAVTRLDQLLQVLANSGPQFDPRRAAARRYLAELVLLYGDPDQALQQLRSGSTDDARLLELWLLARLERFDELVRQGQRSALFGPWPGATLYSSRLPQIDERRARDLARRLLRRAEQRATASHRVSKQEPRTAGEPAAPQRKAQLRQLAGQLHLLLAALRGVRWDPGAAKDLQRARQLLPGDGRPEQLAAQLELFHGEWQRLNKRPREQLIRPLPELRELLQHKPSMPAAVAQILRNLHRGTSSPDRDMLAHRALADLLFHDELTPSQKLLVLQSRRYPHSLRSMLLRLTNLVVFGQRLGLDVTPWRQQLAALRRLMASQPNQRLLWPRWSHGL